MSRNDLLEELGRVAREDENPAAESTAGLDLSDPRWDALSAGALSPEDEADLYRSAISSEAGRRAWEAFRPLDPELDGRIAERLRALAEPADDSGGTQPESDGGTVVPGPFPRRAWGAVASLAAALLLAVALGLFAPQGADPGSDQSLPVYSAEIQGVEEERSTTGTMSPIWTAGRNFQVLLQPERAPGSEVETRVFYSHDPHEGWQEWLQAADHLQIGAESGVVRFKGEFGQALDLAPGSWSLGIVVGKKGALPPTDVLTRALTTGEASGSGNWQLIHRTVEVIEPPVR